MRSESCTEARHCAGSADRFHVGRSRRGAALRQADATRPQAVTTSAYDTIGVDYAGTRRPDPRIAHRISEALGDCVSVVNVGAGTGSYELRDRRVVAVEPSATMIHQRPDGAAPVIRAVAESLPLVDGAVEGAVAILTMHHWADQRRGLAEMRRVARRRVVILTWDQDVFEDFWLVHEYLPCIRDLDRPRAVALTDIASAFGESRILVVPVPHDCVDGFLGAFWRRPDAYLDPRVRSGISVYAAMSRQARDEGLGRLAADIRSGAWEREHRHLLDLSELDLGYRLIVATTR
jgi:SAM-dependent methyltransferase